MAIVDLKTTQPPSAYLETPVPRARMHVYIETSDQRAPLFKDNNLTHSTANPVVADSSGKFPRTYATEGVYRIEIRAENG